MVTKIQGPTRIEAAGRPPKIIDEYTVVTGGVLHLELRDQTLDVAAGDGVIVRAGEWVRYSSPHPDGAQYFAVCLPAFSPDTVHRDV
ncbi:AraC family ligand binding domain-containing protein [bacterium]|nr:AraC family ligand binding domain-containing protein [bacterium]